jgi:hypothetical protein
MVCDVCATPLGAGALFCGECGSSVYTQEVHERREPTDTDVLPKFLTDENDADAKADVDADNLRASSEVVEHVSVFATPLPEPASWATPIHASLAKPKPSYTLTLSTGESLAVSANGLLGRMPQPTEGEDFAHLVIVTDPTRSVSKTHLEFGFDGEQLWVLDRNSGNGSIIRETGKIPRRAEPGRKYIVPRGTRVDLGKAQLLID